MDVARYGRQMLVPGVGKQGQESLGAGRVLVVGCGGIGSTVILYLAGAGVPLLLCDNDVVETSNLHRQIVHDSTEASLGSNKAVSAANHARALNPKADIVVEQSRVGAANVRALVAAVDVVVDATDNYEARYILNDACFLEGMPLVSGSAVGVEGQLCVFDFSERDPVVRGPCYRCLYPAVADVQSCKSCSDAGVLGPVPGLVGCMQAVETMKILMLKKKSAASSGAPSAAAHAGMESLCRRQLLYDAATGSFHSFKLPKARTNCAVCGANPSIENMEDSAASLKSSVKDGVCVPPSPFDLVPVSETTAIEYSYVLESKAAHVLLDVRSAAQFSMVSLGDNKEARRASALKDIEDARAVALNSASAEGGIENSNSSIPVYVLCRRGEDSLVATRYLSKLGVENVCNIHGGLVQWSGSVDDSFPVY
eukprot:GSChrysophyteH2.ASY1.ANO1.1350.1 assembled CDS